MTNRRQQGNRKSRLSVAEVLEPRVLYSANATGAMLPLLIPEEPVDEQLEESQFTNNHSEPFKGEIG